MELAKLEVAKREAVGSNAVRALRDKGRIPGVVYGHKQAAVAVSADRVALVSALSHHAQFVELNVDGSIETAVIRDVQYDTWGTNILHVDFVRVDPDEEIEVQLAIEFFGQPVGLKDGGILEKHVTEVRIRCAPRDIPEFVKVSVKDLSLHQSVLAKHLPLPEGARLVDDPEKALCSLVSARPVEEAAASSAEPEVVGQKKAE